MTYSVKAPHSLLVTLAAAASLTGLIGCSSGDSGPDADTNAQFAELMKRPDVYRVLGQYKSAMDDVESKLVNKIGIRPFTDADTEPNGSGCGSDYPEVDTADASILRFSAGSSRDAIPEDKWNDALALVSGTVQPAGFTTHKVIIDRPHDHEVEFEDGYGGRLIFGTAVRTVLSVRTGCHLTPEAHQRGKPAEEEPLY